MLLYIDSELKATLPNYITNFYYILHHYFFCYPIKSNSSVLSFISIMSRSLFLDFAIFSHISIYLYYFIRFTHRVVFGCVYFILLGFVFIIRVLLIVGLGLLIHYCYILWEICSFSFMFETNLVVLYVIFFKFTIITTL